MKLEVCLFSSLTTLRNEIKQIDDNIVRLIANRINIVKDIGKIKLQLDLPVKNEKVEQANLKRLTDLAEEMNVSPDLINTIYLLVKNYAILVQEEDRRSCKEESQWTSHPHSTISRKTGLSMGSNSS